MQHSPVNLSSKDQPDFAPSLLSPMLNPFTAAAAGSHSTQAATMYARTIFPPASGYFGGPASPLTGVYPPFYPNLMCLHTGYLQNLCAVSDFQVQLQHLQQLLFSQYHTPVKETPATVGTRNTELPVPPVKKERALSGHEAVRKASHKPHTISSIVSNEPNHKLPQDDVKAEERQTLTPKSMQGSPKSDSAYSTQSGTFQQGVTVGYTYDALFISDGRSKRRVNPVAPKDHQRYTCNQCGKSYATSSNLSRHKQTHRALDSVHAKKCPECGKVYVSMPALSMHILTHRLEHKCPTCGKAFSRPWLLQGHMRSHNGQKPFGCAHCGKAFADRSNLRAHMQTHNGLKRYPCRRCGKAFALKSYLNKHMEAACFKGLQQFSPASFLDASATPTSLQEDLDVCESTEHAEDCESSPRNMSV